MLALLLKRFQLGKLPNHCAVSIHALTLLLPFFHLILATDPNVLRIWFGYYLAILVHITGHSLTATFFNEPQESISFYPFFGTFRLAFPPLLLRNDLLITLSGPFLNIAIGAILYFAGTSRSPDVTTFYHLQFLYGIITLIPVYPFDGSRILRLVIAQRTNFDKTIEISNFVGQSFAAAVILWSFYNGYYGLGCVGIGLYLMSRFAPVFQRFIKRINEMEQQANDGEFQSDEFENGIDGSTEISIQEADNDTVYLVENRQGVWEQVEGTQNTNPEPRWYF